jgi:N-methylhydantoinase B
MIRPSSGGNVGLAGGGWGATSDGDGMSATVCLNDGDTHNTPVEASEAKIPVVIRQRALRVDSGGAGRWRGGLGVTQEVELRVPAMYQSQLERTLCAPWGLYDGLDALPNRVGIVRARDQDGHVQRFPTGKVPPTRLEAGDRYLTEMGGGGGFGPPRERDPKRVLQDVRAGYVSLEAAAREYGVVVLQNGRRFELDEAATRRARGG